jgi:hypothetical protein
MPAAIPAWVAWASVAASIAGAGAGVYSSIQAGNDKKKAEEYNAEMDQRQAKDALQRGAIEGAAKKDRARKIASAQAEGAAISGVSASSGTALALLTETAGLGELDALRSSNNAQREAWGLRAQSTLDEFEGKAAQRTGYLNGAGTFLSSAGNAYSSYKAAA